jgi:hypothetical protein
VGGPDPDFKPQYCPPKFFLNIHFPLGVDKWKFSSCTVIVLAIQESFPELSDGPRSRMLKMFL